MKDQQQLIAKMKAISSIAEKPQFEDSGSESSIARKAVPLQDLELWPDEIVCFTAWTGTFSRQEPETRTYVSESRLDEMRRLNDCYRIRRDALAEENAKLRELVREMYPYAKAFLQQGVMLGCNDTKSYDWFLQLRKLGIEVPE